jgi:hypothetical protein
MVCTASGASHIALSRPGPRPWRGSRQPRRGRFPPPHSTVTGILVSASSSTPDARLDPSTALSVSAPRASPRAIARSIVRQVCPVAAAVATVASLRIEVQIDRLAPNGRSPARPEECGRASRRHPLKVDREKIVDIFVITCNHQFVSWRKHEHTKKEAVGDRNIDRRAPSGRRTFAPRQNSSKFRKRQLLDRKPCAESSPKRLNHWRRCKRFRNATATA